MNKEFANQDMQADEEQRQNALALYSEAWPLTDEQKKMLDACSPDKGETDAAQRMLNT